MNRSSLITAFLLLPLFVFSNSVQAEEKERQEFNAFDVIKQAEEQNFSLSKDDKEILKVGRVSTARYVTGGVLGTYPLGFGIGHAIQGTWDHRGWIFTGGELASLAVVVGNLGSCFSGGNCSGATGGLVAFAGFRIWEIIDVWSGVPRYHKRQDEILEALEKPAKKETMSFKFAPVISPNNGMGLGAMVRF